MSNITSQNMSLANAQDLSSKQKTASGVGLLGLFILVLALFNQTLLENIYTLIISLGLIFTGIIWYTNLSYKNKSKGIKNDGIWFKSISSRGLMGWATGIVLTAFYIVLYFYPQLLGLGKGGTSNTGLIAIFDPLSQLLSGRNASQWFVYGTLYTLSLIHI